MVLGWTKSCLNRSPNLIFMVWLHLKYLQKLAGEREIGSSDSNISAFLVSLVDDLLFIFWCSAVRLLL